MTQPNFGTHRFPVQSGHILLFARAIGDPAADETDYATAIAPPTFGYAHHQFLSRFVLRPQPGTPWMGSGRGDSGADATDFEAALHAEQEFTYYRPIRAGLNLLVTTADGPSWAKARRDSGHLAFASAITELRDEASGELVQTARQVAVIIRSGPVPEGTPDAPPAASPSESAPAGDSAALPDVGEKRELVIFDGLTRSQLVMYAGRRRRLQPAAHRRDLRDEGGGLSERVRPRNAHHGRVRSGAHRLGRGRPDPLVPRAIPRPGLARRHAHRDGDRRLAPVRQCRCQR